MNYLLILSYIIAAAVSLFIFFLHIIKRRKFTINRFFSLIPLALFLQYSLLTASIISPFIAGESITIKILIFIPLFIYSMTLLISFMYPLGRLRANIPAFAAVLCIIIADVVLVSLYTGELRFEHGLGIPKTGATFIQIAAILLLMIISPLVLLFRATMHSMNRIRNTVIHYIRGVIASYAVFIAIYFSGSYFGDVPLMQNPFVSIPVIYIIILTSYLLIDLKNNDFLVFYKESFMIFLSIGVYTLPVYFFLNYVEIFEARPVVGILLKSAACFTWLVLSYRVLYPLTEYLRHRKLNSLIEKVNSILVPVNELRKITDMEKFWSFITKDNFQGLESSFGIQSAYFMLINRKDRGYHYTYGFGPGIEPDFLRRDDPIVQQLSSYRGIFEKSFILTDAEIAESGEAVEDFFTRNNLEGAIQFRNMSDVVIGFLFLGTIKGRKGFNSDIIKALEIFRIKLQNLLTTGLILDEVTADQVNDHDRIVVETIKKRTSPDEMVSIPGIRISSLNINNSSHGGDYIDTVKVGKESSILFIADTSYGGIDSALITLQLYSILHSRTMIFNSAEKVLNTMNQVLKTSRISGNTVKASCVIVSSDGNYTCSGASFNPLMIYDPETGSVTEVESAGIPLGIEMNYRYPLTSAKLREGAIGVLYSDGLVTSSNEAGEVFSVERLKDLLVKFSRQNPSIITRELYRELNRFTGGKEQNNDISVIIFKKVKTADE